MLTEKDHIKLAEIIHNAKHACDENQLCWVEMDLIKWLAKDNKKFDKKHFAEACKA